MKYSTVIGTYSRVLGWISLASLIIGLALAYWTDHLNLDLSFIIWFWMGTELKRKNPTARKWAIGISAVVSISIFVMFLTGTGSATFGNLDFTSPDIRYYLMGAGLFLFLGLPGLLLLRKAAKEEFTQLPIKSIQGSPENAPD